MATLKQSLTATISLVSFFLGVIPLQAQNGETTFKSNCAVCHTVGGGKLIGPDLIGVTAKRSDTWLIQWIKGSQAMVQNGDPDAIAIFEEYSKIPMPDQNLSDSEISGVLDYIKSKGATNVSAAATDLQVPIKSSDNANGQELLLGQQIFEGDVRLINKGPSCISCHNLATDRIIAGGLLAKDLTNVYTRMGGDAGLSGILNAPPFPAMTEAYKNKPITKDEIFAIISFLNKVDKESSTQSVEVASSPLLTWGFLGFAFWVCIVLLLWHKKKWNMVKQRIFDRQVKSR